MKVQSAVSAMIMFGMLSSGCSSGSSGTPGSGGGVGASGGSGGGGGGESCSIVTPCGGDLVGTWDVKSSCLKTSGTADISYLGLACLTAQITGTVDVTGTFTLGGDPKYPYTDKTVTKGSDSWVLDAACLNLSGTKVSCSGISDVFAAILSGFGYEEFKCVAAASGGGCTCQGKINSTGGLGLLYKKFGPHPWHEGFQKF